MRNFCVRDTLKDEWFVTSRGRRVWAAAGHAKNAWLNDQPYHSRPTKFADQVRFVVLEVNMVPTTGEPV